MTVLEQAASAMQNKAVQTRRIYFFISFTSMLFRQRLFKLIIAQERNASHLVWWFALRHIEKNIALYGIFCYNDLGYFF